MSDSHDDQRNSDAPVAHDAAPMPESIDGDVPAAEIARSEADNEPSAGRDLSEARRAFEAIVMVATEPVDPQLIAQLLEVSVTQVHEIATELMLDYAERGSGFELAKVGGGYRIQSHPDQAPYVERFVLEGQTARLSAAALETLAIVAYKQPISRGQVAAIRGVDPDGVLRTLQQRGYIDQIGNDSGPGHAILFGTTPQFLAKLGINSLADLPPIAEYVPDADVVEALESGLRIASNPGA
jgi:segregation and condensation protein B